jgi:hypothetical protein
MTEENNQQENEVAEDKKINYWMISSIALGVLVLILLVIIFKGGVTGNVVSEIEAGERLANFAKAQGVEASVLDVSDIGDFYEVTLLIEGYSMPLYVTKDGEFFIESLIPLSLNPMPIEQTQQPTQTSSYSEEELIKLEEFNTCLADNGMVIYGANWCGYTSQVVELLGGFNAIAPVYIECTENQALCAEEGIQGYPTLRLNGGAYQGARTLKDFSQATGCPVPELNINIDANPATASC